MLCGVREQWRDGYDGKAAKKMIHKHDHSIATKSGMWVMFHQGVIIRLHGHSHG
jgi:hypothetical protein